MVQILKVSSQMVFCVNLKWFVGGHPPTFFVSVGFSTTSLRPLLGKPIHGVRKCFPTRPEKRERPWPRHHEPYPPEV